MSKKSFVGLIKAYAIFKTYHQPLGNRIPSYLLFFPQFCGLRIDVFIIIGQIEFIKMNKVMLVYEEMTYAIFFYCQLGRNI